MWQIIYNKLKEKNLNPFAPGQHTGDCLERYCVVKENSQVPFFNASKVGYRVMDVILYTPITSYLAVKTYADEIKTALKEIPDIKLTGGETPVIVDDKVKGYTTSIEIQILKTL